jgi:hypothetical protein
MQAEIPAAVEVVSTETPQALVEVVPAGVVSDAPAAPVAEVAAEVPAEVPALSGGSRKVRSRKGSATLSKTGKKICGKGTHRAKVYSKSSKKMVNVTPIRCTRKRKSRRVHRHLAAIRFSGGEGEQQLEGGSRRRRRSRSRSRR